jgi:N utilization substance protein B
LKTRRRARITALQVLFEVDSVHHDPEFALRERLEAAPLPESGYEFCHALLAGVLARQATLDAIIHEIASEWPIEQMAPIDRNILRLAAFEILCDEATPPKVVINEAVELAKIFGSDSSSRFVNGVLGTLLANKPALSAALSAPHAAPATDGGFAPQ